jgi:hypothetical protein
VFESTTSSLKLISNFLCGPSDISLLSHPLSSLIASNLTSQYSLVLAIDDPHKVVKVIASDGKSGDTRDLTYTNCKVVGNGSFGVVFQAKLVGSPKEGEDIAIKKVLQDKRFKVDFRIFSVNYIPLGTYSLTLPES